MATYINKKPSLFKVPSIFYIFIFMAIRPVVDLQSRYTNDQINAGAIIGILLAMIIVTVFLIKLKKINSKLSIVYSIYAYVFIIGGLSVWINKDLNSTNNDLLRFFIGFSPLLLFSMVSDNYQLPIKKIKLIYFVFVFACTVPILINWLQFVGLYPFTYYDDINGMHLGRPSGGYYHPSSLGRLMMFLCIFSFIMMERNQIKKRLANSLIFLSLVTTIASWHRTTTTILILIMCAFIIGKYFKARIKFHIKKKRIFSSVGIILFLLLPLAVIIKTTISKSNSTGLVLQAMIAGFSSISDKKGDDGNFLRGRGEQWKETKGIIDNGSTIQKIFGLGFSKIESHNDYYRILQVYGISGLIAHFAILGLLFLWLWERIDSKGHFSLIVLFGSLIAFGITLEPMGYPNFMWWFFMGNFFILMLYKKKHIEVDTVFPFNRNELKNA